MKNQPLGLSAVPSAGGGVHRRTRNVLCDSAWHVAHGNRTRVDHGVGELSISRDTIPLLCVAS